MEKLKEMLKSNQVKAFLWTTMNGIIALALLYFADIDWQYAPVVIACLNMATKAINKKYL